jgi:hypothetical protein
MEEESTENTNPPFIIGLRARLITHNPCDVDWKRHPELQLTEKERVYFIDRLSNWIQTSLEVRPELRLTEDFKASQLTPEKVRFLCNCIDTAFYNGDLLKRVREDMKCEILFDYKPFYKDPSIFQPCAKTVFSTREHTEELVKVMFCFNYNRFGDSARCRETNGIQVRHKLEALLTTMLHEFAHLFLKVACKKAQGHGRRFQDYNRVVNGAHKGKFSYQDLQTCPVHDFYQNLKK